MKIKVLIAFILMITIGVYSATFDDDDLGDVFVVSGGGGVYWYETAGDNSIVLKSSITNDAICLDVGHINTNGKFDLIVGRGTAGNASWYEATGNEDELTWIKNFSEYWKKIGIGDIDSDYKGNLFITKSTNGIYHYEGATGSSTTLNYIEHVLSNGVVATLNGDFNGNGLVDYVLADDYYLYWYESDGTDDGYTLRSQEYIANGIKDIAIGNFDSDSLMDIMVVTANRQLLWYEAVASPSYDINYLGAFALASVYNSVAIGDADSDGVVEMLAGTDYSLDWYESTGNNSGQCVSSTLVWGGVVDVAIAESSGPATLWLNGGNVTFGEKTTIMSTPRWDNGVRIRTDLNFCFAERFSDGVIWFNHTIGLHQVNERGSTDYSPDNGITWYTDTGRDITGYISEETSTGGVIALKCWDSNQYYGHNNVLNIKVWADTLDSSPTSSWTQPVFYMPYASSIFLHRSLIRLSNGNLIATGYGKRLNENKSYTFCIQSTNNGSSWTFLSTMAYDPNTTYEEGFTEPCIVELADGSLLSLCRTGMQSPLVQVKSTDGGATWSTPVEIADTGVGSTVKRLSNGTLVASSGRPGLYLLVDFTGTGNSWQRVDIYDPAATSSYPSILEVAESEIMLIYDQSDFCSWVFPDGFQENKIVGQYINIVKN